MILKEEISYEWLMEIDGRPILLADLGNEKVLFYTRTGSGGEPREGDPDAGQFAPFFGFSYRSKYEYWFIKGEPTRYDKYAKEAKWLDKNVKDTPNLPSMNLFEANKLFISKDATLSRPNAEKMGYKVFTDWPIIMEIKGKKLGLRKILRAVEDDYKYFKQKDQHPSLIKVYDELENYLEDIKISKLKYIGNVLQPKKKQFIIGWVNKMNSIRKKALEIYSRFKKLWDEWDLPKVNFDKLEYIEVNLSEANNIKDLWE